MAINLKDTADGIVKIFNYVKNNGFFKITKIILELIFWGLLIHGAVNYETIFKTAYETVINISIEDHSKLMNHRLLITDDVNNILTNVYKETGANKSFIFEFHNGNKNLTGMPFYFMDMTYERLDSTCAIPTKYNWIDVSLSYYSFIPYAYETGYFVGSVDEIMKYDELFAYKLKSENVHYLAALLLYGKKEPIGIIGVTSDKPFAGDDKTILNELTKAAQRITPMLDTSVILGK